VFPLLPQKIRLVHRLLPTIVPFAFRPTVLTGFFILFFSPVVDGDRYRHFNSYVYAQDNSKSWGGFFCEIWERDSPWTTEEFLNFGMQW